MLTRYFDHNATTPVAPEVCDVMTWALREVCGNPSSVHAAGQFARQRLENSRSVVSKFVHASPAELVFTSGGTESNNLAILGVVRSVPRESKHVITTAIEHPAVLDCCRQLEREGVAVSYVDVDSTGVCDVEAIRRELRPDTVLVSVMHANNEIGTIQPIAGIAAALKEHQAWLHSDGVQAFGKVDVNIQSLGVDLYSFSAHKIYAPKGIGGVYVRRGTPLEGVHHGGRHERGRRPGTENVAGAIAFARATELGLLAGEIEHLRDRFEAQVMAALGEVELNGDPRRRLPNTSNLLFRGISGETLVIALDMKGMAISSGSACSSGSVEPSHVLLAIGRTVAEARSCARFSFGRYNTAAEVDELADAVIASVRQLRKTTRKEAALVTA